MKILAINGSHRGSAGHTAFLLKKLSNGIVSAGGEFESVDLARLKINHCLSCGKCNSPDHYLKCVFEEKDDARSVFDKMAAADIIVFATPIYIFTMTGLMKNFLDRMYATADVFDLNVTKSGLIFHHVDEAICSKPFVALVCCDNVEKETPKNVISYFKTYAKFNDAPLAGMLVRNAGRFAGHGRKPEMEQIAPKLTTAYAAFEKAGRELVKNGCVSRSTEKEASCNIIPMPPIFKVLKHFRPFKEKMVQQARQMTKYEEGAV